MKTPKICCLLTAIALAQSSLFGVSTDPVGFVSISVPANSDAILAVPLNRAAEFKGVIQSISGNVITVTGTPAWTANAFAPGVTANKTYAVQIAGGAKEGLIGRITGNGVDTITVSLDSGDDLTNIGTVAIPLDPDGAGPLTAQADQIDIKPYWTPGSLLGTNLPAATEFLGFENSGTGVNKAASEIYGATGSSWENGETGDDATHSPIRFGKSFILRNNSASPISLSMVGSVPMTAAVIRLSTLGNNTDQDQRIGFMSPVPESIINLNIPAQAGDIIFGFDNSASGKNKSASIVYAFDGTNWVNDETGDPLSINDKLQPGFGYMFRKFRTATPQTVVWRKLPSYLQ